MIYALLFPFLATVVATFFGALIRYLTKNVKKEILIFLHNFSTGGIISLIFLELIPESYNLFKDSGNNNFISALYLSLICLLSGLLFFLFHELSHFITKHHQRDHDDKKECVDHLHSDELLNKEESSGFISSLIFLLAIFIHNIPEGLSLGLNFISDKTFPIAGSVTSLILFLHNIIIGFSLMNSFLLSAKKVQVSFLMSILSALPAYFLALIGYFFRSINISPLFNAIILSFSSGSLIYVFIIELLPQMFYQYKSKYSFIYILLGILLSLILIYL